MSSLTRMPVTEADVRVINGELVALHGSGRKTTPIEFEIDGTSVDIDNSSFNVLGGTTAQQVFESVDFHLDNLGGAFPLASEEWGTWYDNSTGTTELNIIRTDSSDNTVLNAINSKEIQLSIDETTQWTLDPNGNLLPESGNELGSSSKPLSKLTGSTLASPSGDVGTLAGPGHLKLIGSEGKITQSTLPGSDNRSLVLNGSGDGNYIDVSRGAVVALYGNDHPGEQGRMLLASERAVEIFTGASPNKRWVFDQNGHLAPASGLIYNLGTPSLRLSTVYTSDIQSQTGTFSSDLIVEGRLIVSGTQTVLNTEELLVEDNIFTLNSTHTGVPVLDAGMEVNRGSEAYARFFWDESEDYFVLGVSGSEERVITENHPDPITLGNSLKLPNDVALLSSTVSGVEVELLKITNNDDTFLRAEAGDLILQSDSGGIEFLSGGSSRWVLENGGDLVGQQSTTSIRTLTDNDVLTIGAGSTNGGASGGKIFFYGDDHGTSGEVHVHGQKFKAYPTSVELGSWSINGSSMSAPGGDASIISPGTTGAISVGQTNENFGAHIVFVGVNHAVAPGIPSSGTLELNAGVTDDAEILFRTGGNDRWGVKYGGSLLPASSGSYDIGSESLTVRDLYVDTIFTSAISGVELGGGSYDNEEWIQWRNDLDNADLDVIRVNSSNSTEIQTTFGNFMYLLNGPSAEMMRLSRSGDTTQWRYGGNLTIASDSDDGADDHQLNLAGGGGGASRSRGAFIQLFGREHASEPGNVTIQAASNAGASIDFNTGDTIDFRRGNTLRWQFDSSSHFVPAASGTYDVGSDSLPIRGVYANSLRAAAGNSSDIEIYTNDEHQWTFTERAGAQAALRFVKGNVGAIYGSTSDGADTGALVLGGGGDAATSRGALITLRGNESSAPGNLDLRAGSLGTARVTFNGQNGAFGFRQDLLEMKMPAPTSQPQFRFESGENGGYLDITGGSNAQTGLGSYVGFRGNSNALSGGAQAGQLRLGAGNAEIVFITHPETERWHIKSDGHFIPQASGTYDIGSVDLPLRDIYAQSITTSASPGAKLSSDGSRGILDSSEDNDLRIQRNSVPFIQLEDGHIIFTQPVTMESDLNVSGTNNIINTEELLVEDNIITLNSTASGIPTLDAGFEVNRGNEDYSQLLWDESEDYFVAGVSGSLEKIILASDSPTDMAAIPNNTPLQIQSTSGTVDALYVDGSNITTLRAESESKTLRLSATASRYIQHVYDGGANWSTTNGSNWNINGNNLTLTNSIGDAALSLNGNNAQITATAPIISGLDGNTLLQIKQGSGQRWKFSSSALDYQYFSAIQANGTQTGIGFSVRGGYDANSGARLDVYGLTHSTNPGEAHLVSSSGILLTSNGNSWDLGLDGHLVPGASGTQNIGSSDNYVGTLYVNDIQGIDLGVTNYEEETSTSATLQVNTEYSANNASLVTLTLPATASAGDKIRVIAKGAGGFRIAQSAGQTIHHGTNSTTTGATGYIESTNQYDVLEIQCVTDDIDFVVVSSIGNFNTN